MYFGQGEIFCREDVLVPVFQKEPEGGRTLCYCFAVSEDEIRREVEGLDSPSAKGHSLSLVRRSEPA